MRSPKFPLSVCITVPASKYSGDANTCILTPSASSAASSVTDIEISSPTLTASRHITDRGHVEAAWLLETFQKVLSTPIPWPPDEAFVIQPENEHLFLWSSHMRLYMSCKTLSELCSHRADDPPSMNVIRVMPVDQALSYLFLLRESRHLFATHAYFDKIRDLLRRQIDEHAS